MTEGRSQADPAQRAADGLDPKARKIALGAVETGIYLLGSSNGGMKNVMMASWVCQCSFEPPRVMLGLKRDTLTNQLVREGGGFTVNIPGKDQRELAKKFFKHASPEGNEILGERFTASPTFGAPVLEAVPAWFEARVVEWIEGGDHDVVIGEVTAVGAPHGERFEPLLEATSGWRYGG